jgi:hypothetical protein
MQSNYPNPQNANVQPHSCSNTGAHPQGAGQYPNHPPLHLPEAGNAYNYGPGEYAYYQDGGYYPAEQAVGYRSWFDFSNSSYLKGFLIGAGVTLLLTNPTTQKTLVRGAVRIWSFVQGGVEEVKEQFQDVKAEMSQEQK